MATLTGVKLTRTYRVIWNGFESSLTISRVTTAFRDMIPARHPSIELLTPGIGNRFIDKATALDLLRGACLTSTWNGRCNRVTRNARPLA